MIQYQGLKTLENLEIAKKYNQWIIDQFLTYLKDPILEVGSGTGNIASYLSKNHKVFLSDNDSGLVKTLQKKFRTNRQTSIFLYDVTKPAPAKYKNFFSTVIAINVLEHIEDDEKAIKNIAEILKKNGRFCILVPAKQFAYTHLDKKLGHFRRYEKNDLVAKLLTNGFVIEKIYPFNLVGLIGWFFIHKLSKKHHDLNSNQIQTFEHLVPLLRIFERIFPIPMGISLIAVARKR